MTLINQLKANKGTVSSQLGKDVAQMILSGKSDCLKEALELAIVSRHYSSYVNNRKFLKIRE
jgi:hypothetical protein